MEHVAIDLGGRESQICVRARNEEILEEKRALTSSLGGYLSTRGHSRVILETCSEAFAIADQAVELGHEVRVVPATLVRTLGVGARKLKTDKRDARILSEVSCRIDLPSVHIPSQQARELKTICGLREALVGTRTKLINNVVGWLRTHALRVRSGTTKTFPSRIRTLLENSSLKPPAAIERHLVLIEAVTEQILASNAELKTTAEGITVCKRLMSVPGVGPLTAVRFVAAIDDVTRFPTAHAVASYLGLVPGESSSSDKKRRLAITKAGSAKVRWTLVQAAWSVWRHRPLHPMVLWAKNVASRRGKPIAIIALARKIAGVMFALWRDGTTYEAKRAAT